MHARLTLADRPWGSHGQEALDSHIRTGPRRGQSALLVRPLESCQRPSGAPRRLTGAGNRWVMSSLRISVSSRKDSCNP
jgi:hypothetical protein